MDELEIGFGELVVNLPHDGYQTWQTQRDRAINFIKSIGDDTIFSLVSSKLRTNFDKSQSLGDPDEIAAFVGRSASTLGLPIEATQMLQRHEVQSIAISGGVATYLKQDEPNQQRIEAVVSFERYLDIEFVATMIAQSDAAVLWTTRLRGAGFAINSINGDEYQAGDELERWRKERTKPVPGWRHGDFPHEGMTALEIISETLRALDVDAWLALLDRQELPAIVEALLWASKLDRQPALLLDLIRRAPAAFDDRGMRTDSFLIFVLERKAISLMENYLLNTTRWGSDRELTELVSTKMKKARGELAESIRSRPDGVALLVELSGRSMNEIDRAFPESGSWQARESLHRELAVGYFSALGVPAIALQHARARAKTHPNRSLWGLWLACSNYCLAVAGSMTEAELEVVLRECWTWLSELLGTRDSGVAERHGPIPQWVDRLAGTSLWKMEDRVDAVENAWESLSNQRLARQENRHAADPWATSKLLIRATFFTARIEDDPSTAATLWQVAMEMAVSGWFANSSADPFAEMRIGLCHLAKGALQVPDEPRRTFEYLVGQRAEVVESILALLANEMVPARVLKACTDAGIDPCLYLRLDHDERRKEAVAVAIDKLCHSTAIDKRAEP